MRTRLAAALLALGTAWAGTAGAQALTRVEPQPTGLKPGLAVSYVYPPDVKDLDQAERYRGNAQPGAPLIGFDYPDTTVGEKALTSNAAEKVVAFISGYIHFDKAGPWKIRLQSNDGVVLSVGGEEIYEHDGRHACSTVGWRAEYQVPEPGWYALEATWFQRSSTSCLLMEWAGPGDDFDWTPNEAFGY